AESDDSEGTIGINARRRLKRLPTHIYWQGLASWGIRVYPGSQSQYHRSLDRFYRSSALSIRTDDGEPLAGGRLRNWHVGIPGPPPEFPRKVSLSLTQVEAEYLRERIAQRAPQTLLAFMVDHAMSTDGTAFPWEHPDFARFPERNIGELFHARNFSELM